MSQSILHPAFGNPQQKAALARVRRFVVDHGSAILNASMLLGGPGARQRCAKLSQDLREASELTRRLRFELVELHRLLSLDRVGDPDAIETACFVEIDPDDPRVHDLCRLADGVYDLLVSIADNDADAAAVGAYLAEYAA